MDEFRPLFTSLYCGFIYKQGTIRCGIFRKIETKRQCCLLWCFICKNLDNIISRPQRTVQNNKKTKAVHDPCKHPTSFRLSQKWLLLVLLSWAWLEHGLEWPCQLSQTQKYFFVVVPYNVLLHDKCSEVVVSCQFGIWPEWDLWSCSGVWENFISLSDFDVI